jgi:peptidoglycan/LPS O-acetylase OafA/YrhL
MLQTFLAPAISADGQIWTLAVEWWLYMIAPVLRKLAMVFVALAAATSFFYLVGLHVGDAATLQHGRAFLGLAWYWLLGFIYYKYRRTLTGYTVLIIPAFFAYFLLTFLGAAFWIGLFAVAFCDRLWVPKWSRAVMKWLGDVSYPLYLLHVPVLILCVHYHITSSVAICTLAVLASIAALHLVDLPIRRRFRPNAGDSQRFGQAALSATKSASPL